MINVKKIVTVGALFVLLAQSFAMQAMKRQLYLACLNGDTSTVESLLGAGADVNADFCSITPLHSACIGGHTEVVSLLLATNRVDINAKISHSGFTPLHLACKRGNIEVVELLLTTNRVDVNAKNAFGEIPLHYACFKGDIEVVRLLLANGAQVTEKILNRTENLAIKRLVSKVYEFQHSENKLEFILKHIQNDQEEDPEDKKELIKIVCKASLAQMLKNCESIEETLFYQLHQNAPDILLQTFEVESLQVDNLMDCIIKEKDICLTKQMQEMHDELSIYAPGRFEFLKQQCTDRGMTISTNDRELKMPSFLGLQVVSPLLVEEIEEEEEGD